MKHTFSVTAGLVLLFVVSQLIGLGFLATQMQTSVDEQGNIVVDYEEVAIGPRPDTTGAGSFLYMVIAVAVGTSILLILAKLKKFMVWKFWFFLAVWLTIVITLDTLMPVLIALLLAAALAAWKIQWNNPIIHNLTEILTYTGIAILLVPIFDVLWASILLLAIAIYDMIAVWKSKHMVTMAKFQTESKLFAGMLIPYGDTPKGKVVSKPSAKTVSVKRQAAILGGGDIAFPLIFAGVVMQHLLTNGLTKMSAYLFSLIPILGATIGLSVLFYLAKKDHFYPAMPPLVFGCYLGFLVVALIV